MFCADGCVERVLTAVCLFLCLCYACPHCAGVFGLMLVLRASSLPCVCGYACTCVVGALNTVVLMLVPMS